MQCVGDVIDSPDSEPVCRVTAPGNRTSVVGPGDDKSKQIKPMKSEVRICNTYTPKGNLYIGGEYVSNRQGGKNLNKMLRGRRRRTWTKFIKSKVKQENFKGNGTLPKLSLTPLESENTTETQTDASNENHTDVSNRTAEDAEDEAEQKRVEAMPDGPEKDEKAPMDGRNHTIDETHNHTIDESHNHTNDESHNHTNDDTNDESHNHTNDESHNSSSISVHKINHTEELESIKNKWHSHTAEIDAIMSHMRSKRLSLAKMSVAELKQLSRKVEDDLTHRQSILASHNAINASDLTKVTGADDSTTEAVEAMEAAEGVANKLIKAEQNRVDAMPDGPEKDAAMKRLAELKKHAEVKTEAERNRVEAMPDGPEKDAAMKKLAELEKHAEVKAVAARKAQKMKHMAKAVEAEQNRVEAMPDGPEKDAAMAKLAEQVKHEQEMSLTSTDLQAKAQAEAAREYSVAPPKSGKPKSGTPKSGTPKSGNFTSALHKGLEKLLGKNSALVNPKVLATEIVDFASKANAEHPKAKVKPIEQDDKGTEKSKTAEVSPGNGTDANFSFDEVHFTDFFEIAASVEEPPTKGAHPESDESLDLGEGEGRPGGAGAARARARAPSGGAAGATGSGTGAAGSNPKPAPAPTPAPAPAAPNIQKLSDKGVPPPGPPTTATATAKPAMGGTAGTLIKLVKETTIAAVDVDSHEDVMQYLGESWGDTIHVGDPAADHHTNPGGWANIDPVLEADYMRVTNLLETAETSSVSPPTLCVF